MAEIAARFRFEIAGGMLVPGSRLPTREQIAGRRGVSINTVQRAMCQLEEEGFIVSRGKLGTFVSEWPPSAFRYALVLAHHRNEDVRNRIDQFGFVLAQEAKRLSGAGRDFAIYDGISGHIDDTSYAKLEDDIRHYRVAGIISVVPYKFVHLPAMAICRRNRIPVVGLPARGSFGDLIILRPDPDKVLRCGVRYLALQGVRKVALIMQETDEDVAEKAAGLIREFGLETRPYWLLSVPAAAKNTARRLAHLMMLCKEKPDALFITDDILVEPVTRGLVDAGKNRPRKLRVLGACNFPYPTPSRVAADRIGFDITEILEKSAALIDAQRNVGKAPRETHASVVLEQSAGPDVSVQRRVIYKAS